MIRRILRWFAPQNAPVTPPPCLSVLEQTAWRPGDLALCIANGWLKAPKGAPALDQLCKVAVVEVHPLAEAEPLAVWLKFDQIPGCYAAFGFVRCEPDLTPAAPAFTRDLNRISERVKARQEER
jgi:hypothetical protein